MITAVWSGAGSLTQSVVPGPVECLLVYCLSLLLECKPLGAGILSVLVPAVSSPSQVPDVTCAREHCFCQSSGVCLFSWVLPLPPSSLHSLDRLVIDSNLINCFLGQPLSFHIVRVLYFFNSTNSGFLTGEMRVMKSTYNGIVRRIIHPYGINDLKTTWKLHIF